MTARIAPTVEAVAKTTVSFKLPRALAAATIASPICVYAQDAVLVDGGDEVTERVVGAGWADVVVGEQGGRIERRERGGGIGGRRRGRAMRVSRALSVAAGVESSEMLAAVATW
jgi:hypothetical protein